MKKRKGDKFGKSDIAQILVGSFVIAQSTYSGSKTEFPLSTGILVFLILLAVAVIIFSIISINRKGIFLRIAITVPAVLFIATILQLVLTRNLVISNILIHSGIALPICAGIDAIKD